MKCPNCGRAKLVQDTRDVPYIYKDFPASQKDGFGISWFSIQSRLFGCWD